MSFLQTLRLPLCSAAIKTLRPPRFGAATKPESLRHLTSHEGLFKAPTPLTFVLGNTSLEFDLCRHSSWRFRGLSSVPIGCGGSGFWTQGVAASRLMMEDDAPGRTRPIRARLKIGNWERHGVVVFLRKVWQFRLRIRATGVMVLIMPGDGSFGAVVRLQEVAAAVIKIGMQAGGRSAGNLSSGRVSTSIPWSNVNFRPKSRWVSIWGGAFGIYLWFWAQRWTMLWRRGLLGYRIWDPWGVHVPVYGYFGTNETTGSSGVVLKDDSCYYAGRKMVNEWTLKQIPPWVLPQTDTLKFLNDEFICRFISGVFVRSAIFW